MVPLFGLIAPTLFNLAEKIYFVFYKISEWSLGPGYAPEYSIEKFHIVLEEFIAQRVVGCILFGCTALGMITWSILSYIAQGNTLFFSKFKEKKVDKEQEECCNTSTGTSKTTATINFIRITDCEGTINSNVIICRSFSRKRAKKSLKPLQKHISQQVKELSVHTPCLHRKFKELLKHGRRRTENQERLSCTSSSRLQRFFHQVRGRKKGKIRLISGIDRGCSYLWLIQKYSKLWMWYRRNPPRSCL